MDKEASFFRLITELNTNLLVLVDDRGTINYASPSFFKLLSLTEENLPAWTEIFEDPLHKGKDFLPELKRKIQDPLNILPIPYRTKIKDSSGNVFLVQWLESPGPGNTLLYTGQDVSHEMELDVLREMKESELKRLSLVAEETKNIILILDAQGNVEWVSKTFETLNKITLPELIAKKGRNIRDISNNPEIHKILDEVMATLKPKTYESRNMNIDEEIWEFSTISPVLDESGKLSHIIIIDSDITDKKKMEAELEKLSIVAARTDNAVLIAGKDGTIEWINDGLLRMYSRNIQNPKEILGKNFIELSSYPGIAGLIDKVKSNPQSVSYDSESHNEAGNKFWVQSTITPILDAAGSVSRFVIIDTDITQRKLDEEIIREKNKDITDSINYARRIQNALLPDPEKFSRLLGESFVLFLPRDIVSGDFYFSEFIRTNQGTELVGFAVGDCTGHGVPGAFLSLIGATYLQQSLKQKEVNSPAEALEFVSQGMENLLFRNDVATNLRDGIEMGFCVLNRKTRELNFSGASRPLIIVGSGGVKEVAGTKRHLGYAEKRIPFENHSLTLMPGDVVYLVTDGFGDQFGGDKGKKFKFKNLKKILAENYLLPMEEQKQKLDQLFAEWKGNLEQVDDVCVLAVRIP
jgi:PAS domain S-box-containing protein